MVSRELVRTGRNQNKLYENEFSDCAEKNGEQERRARSKWNVAATCIMMLLCVCACVVYDRDHFMFFSAFNKY